MSNKFSPIFLDDLRQRLRLSDIIGERVTFDKKKSNPQKGQYWACCPFHREKTPSFLCDDKKGFYHCFGCKESGDHIHFLRKNAGMQFLESVEYLARKAGVDLPKPDLKMENQAKKNYELYEVMELACQYYSKNLTGEKGYKARSYLSNRGIFNDSIEKFRLGYAFSENFSLREYLLGKGIPVELMEICGLISKTEEGHSYYDRFRDRIIFPIINLQNKIVGFGGRALQKNTAAKYLNSPATDLFQKGSMLYNLQAARYETKKINQEIQPLIVVEGYMDVITLSKYGFSNAVSPLGTAVTEEQLLLLWRYCSHPILCFDGDEAGMKAASRVIDRALPLINAQRSLRFVLLPKNTDPDELLRAKGADFFGSYLQKTLSFFDLLWKELIENYPLEEAEEKAHFDAIFQEKLKKITNKTLAYHYKNEGRARLKNLFYQKSFQNRGKKKLFKITEIQWNSLKSEKKDVTLREATILNVILKYPNLWIDHFESLSGVEFMHQLPKKLHKEMLDIVSEERSLTEEEMKEKLYDRGLKEAVDEIEKKIKSSHLPSNNKNLSFEMAQEILKQALYLHFLQSKNLKKQIQDIEVQVTKTAQEKSFSDYPELQKKLEKMASVKALMDEID